MVAWQYQNDVEPQLIGLHFLALNTGYVIAAGASQRLLHKLSPRDLEGVKKSGTDSRACFARWHFHVVSQRRLSQSPFFHSF